MKIVGSTFFFICHEQINGHCSAHLSITNHRGVSYRRVHVGTTDAHFIFSPDAYWKLPTRQMIGKVGQFRKRNEKEIRIVQTKGVAIQQDVYRWSVANM